MTTIKVLRPLRILEIIIICYLAASVEGKSLNKQKNEGGEIESGRVKRGYSHYGGNDFGSTGHVSSAVLQFSDDHISSLDSGSHLESSSLSSGHSGGLEAISLLDSSTGHADPWLTSGHSSGQEVWLEPLPNYHESTSSDLDLSQIHSTSLAASHPGTDHLANTVFSDDSTHSLQFNLPNPHLHTQISGSSRNSISSNIGDIDAGIHDHGAVAISDNIDFSNVADFKSKHYAKSYGK